MNSVPCFRIHEGGSEAGGVITDTANGQDHMAVVTQGATADRAREHRGASDLGIVLYRQLLAGQIDRVEEVTIRSMRDSGAAEKVIELPARRQASVGARA